MIPIFQEKELDTSHPLSLKGRSVCFEYSKQYVAKILFETPFNSLKQYENVFHEWKASSCSFLAQIMQSGRSTYQKKECFYYLLEKFNFSFSNMVEDMGKQKINFSTEEYLYICQQLLSALCFLENNKIAHGHLKLENIFLERNGKLKLSDIGNPFLLEDIKDKAIWIAPELTTLDSEKISKENVLRSDVFSLGIILIELGVATRINQFSDIHKELTNLNLKYGSDIAQEIENLLEGDPNKRISIKDALTKWKHIVSINNYSLKDALPSILLKLKGGKSSIKETKIEEKKIEIKKEKKPRVTRPVINSSYKYSHLYSDDGKFGTGEFSKSQIKISQWNLNSIVRVLNLEPKVQDNPVHKYLKDTDPDIFCVTETHLLYEELDKEPIKSFLKDSYIPFYNCYKGEHNRHGTAFFTKVKPISVFYDLGEETHDQEGRTITLEYKEFFLVNCYVPNAGRELQRLDYRTKEWDPFFREFLAKLSLKKHVILCGDLNVAHQEIDIFNPKRYAGFTIEERNEFTKLLNLGFVDTFRYLYPKERKYTFFSSHYDSRAGNNGWRLDYFIVNKSAVNAVKDYKISKDVLSSDHCPNEILLDISYL